MSEELEQAIMGGLKQMIKVEFIETFNWKGALRGMRNPKESWNKSDSIFHGCNILGEEVEPQESLHCTILKIGSNDLTLCKALIRGGSEHRKFLRQIFISFDVTTPEYWWKEYETYQIGTTENSTSTMHKLGSRLLTNDDFEFDYKSHYAIEQITIFINKYNGLITHWKNLDGDREAEDKLTEWRYLIQTLPMSFKYKRTCSLNYEVLRTMYGQRKNHKLIEWHDFFEQVLKEIPYPEFITES